jgi:copper transport protein
VRAFRILLAPMLAILGTVASASTAFGHAQLLDTSPQSGSTVATQPAQVIFKFNQAVGGTLGAVRVYDAQGREVDDLAISHPEGQERWMGVGLRAHLPDGTYTATYRVISADTHIVYGGLVFNIGRAGATPKFTIAGLIGRNESGGVTKVAFGVVRSLDYLSIALLVGGMAFLLLVWLPGLRVEQEPSSQPAKESLLAQTVAESSLTQEFSLAQTRRLNASQAFTQRLKRMFAFAIVLGLLVSVLGVLLQGASAAGVSLWSSLKSPILDSTLESRFGQVWGIRAIDWLALGGLLLIARALRRETVPLLRSVAPGADGIALPARLPRWTIALLGLGAAYLVCTPALAGHASAQSPTAVFFPADVVHVLAASVWVGGIVCLLLALPAATRCLEATERSRLLLAVLARFSPLALAAVVAIALTGVVQAYIDVRSIHGLLHTTYGALVLAKTALLLGLIGLGWINRERLIPALRRRVDAEQPPGMVGILTRRSLRGELALMLCVLGVTAALVSYAPPIDAAGGPFSINATLGPSELEMTVDPASGGTDTIHLYLIDAKSGTQFTATKELTVTAALTAKGIGPLRLQASLAGPGHYTLNSVALSPKGTWTIQVTDRVSEFEEYTRTVKVPIE